MKSGDFGTSARRIKGSRQSLRMVDVVEAEAALHAQPLVIGRAVAALDADDRFVLDVIGDLAADAAVRADRRHGPVRNDEIGVVRRRERACRARLHAFAAGDARRGAHRVVEVEHDLRVRAAKRVADDVVDLLLAAGAHAARALDARVEVDRHRRMREVGRGLRTRREARLPDAELALPLGELRVGLVDARRDVGGEQLDDQLLREQRARSCRSAHPFRAPARGSTTAPARARP